MVGHSVPEQGCQAGARYGLPGVETEITQDGTRLPAPRQDAFTHVGCSPERPEQMNAYDRLTGALSAREIGRSDAIQWHDLAALGGAEHLACHFPPVLRHAPARRAQI